MNVSCVFVWALKGKYIDFDLKANNSGTLIHICHGKERDWEGATNGKLKLWASLLAQLVNNPPAMQET